MKKIREVLKDNSGQGVPMILAVVLCCLILACVTFEYMRLMIVAQGVRDSVQSAIVDVATENWDEAYAGLREGYSGGYQLSGSSWSQNVTSGNVYARLQNVLGVEYEGGQYVKYSGEDLEYRLYDLHLEVENAPLAPSVPDGITQLNVTGTITVDVPLSFGFGHLPPHADHHETQRQICSQVLILCISPCRFSIAQKNIWQESHLDAVFVQMV